MLVEPWLVHGLLQSLCHLADAIHRGYFTRLLVKIVGAVQNKMSSEFSVSSWAEGFEISQASLDALGQKGFSTHRTLSKRTPDLIKQEFKKLPLAQILLLQEACESLCGATGSQAGAALPQSQGVHMDGPGASSSNGGALTAEEIAALLDHGGSVLSDSSSFGKPNLFDPLQFNLGHANSKSTFRDIRDYIALVPTDPTSAQGQGTVKLGEQEFLLKDTKIPWELLNVAQYMEGSLKILREMALEDKCAIGELLEYVGYNNKNFNPGTVLQLEVGAKI